MLLSEPSECRHGTYRDACPEPQGISMDGESNTASQTAMLPEFAAGCSIPKVIHQVYFSKTGRVPAIIRRNIDKICALNPDWDHRLYDDRDMEAFIASTYGEPLLSYYSRIHGSYGASRTDLFRYLLMYKTGGLYLDIKSSMERPLQSVLHPEDVFVLARWPLDAPYEGWGLHRELRHLGLREFQQWHIAAAPGHPFLRAVIETVVHKIALYNPFLHKVGRYGVLRLTGPVAYTQAIAPLLHRHPHRLVDSHEALGFTYSIVAAAESGSHRALFNSDYVDLREPVAEPTGAIRTLWLTYSFLRKVKRQVKDGFAYAP
jgi:inositol phosphorylceramide mannosyltransferase catalytic subunit